jgi:hypothetical protein
MLEPTEAKELIEETVERIESHDAQEAREERSFRERLSLLVGIFAVILAIVHVIGAGLVRENIVNTIRASDTYNYMQAKKLRQEIMTVGALSAPVDQRERLTAAAAALDRPDAKGHSISQLQASADKLTEEANQAGTAGEYYEWAETALQMAIVLLSIAMIASSRLVAWGACLLAAGGVALAAVTHMHLLG